jgi:hypothetical protein
MPSTRWGLLELHCSTDSAVDSVEFRLEAPTRTTIKVPPSVFPSKMSAADLQVQSLLTFTSDMALHRN